nr:MAG TPA: hypothetical protein [Caudoviricetes sp.]
MDDENFRVLMYESKGPVSMYKRCIFMHNGSEMNTFNQPGKAQNIGLFPLSELCYNSGRGDYHQPDRFFNT